MISASNLNELTEQVASHVASWGWDQNSSLWLITDSEGGFSVSDVRSLATHPYEALQKRHAPPGTTAVVLIFEGWTYPEFLEEQSFAQQKEMTPPSQHPNRVEVRQGVTMGKDGHVILFSQKRGKEPEFFFEDRSRPETINIGIEGSIPDALRCYLGAPFLGLIKSPFATWLEVWLGRQIEGVFTMLAAGNIEEVKATDLLLELPGVVKEGLEGRTTSPLGEMGRVLDEQISEGRSPSKEATWKNVRMSMIDQAVDNNQTSAVLWLRWADDALLQKQFEDTEINNKISSALAFVGEKDEGGSIRGMAENLGYVVPEI